MNVPKNIKSHSKANGLIFSFFIVFSELVQKVEQTVQKHCVKYWLDHSCIC